MQNRLIQTSETVGHQYSDASPLVFPAALIPAPGLTLPELGDDSLDLAPVGRNIPEASPVVGLDGEVSQRQETQNSSAAVADQNVQNPVIPPVVNFIKHFRHDLCRYRHTALSFDLGYGAKSIISAVKKFYDIGHWFQ